MGKNWSDVHFCDILKKVFWNQTKELLSCNELNEATNDTNDDEMRIYKVGVNVQKYLEKARKWLQSDKNCFRKFKKSQAPKEDDNSFQVESQQEESYKAASAVSGCRDEIQKMMARLREILGCAVYYAAPFRRYIIAGCAALVLLLGFCFYQAFSMGYVVMAQGQPLFKVLDEESVYRAVDRMETELKQNRGIEVDFRSEIEVKPALVRDSKAYSERQIRACLGGSLGSRVDAAAIVVDGKPRIFVPDQQTAEKVLAELKEFGSKVEEDEVLKEVALKENIDIQDCQAAVRNLNSVDSALELIRTGEERPVVYTVESGDTLWTIARKNNMMVDQITTVNNINENEILSIGQELVLSKCDPLISVVATVERRETEKIPFETELKEDNKVNGIKITQEGEDGEKIVSYAETRVNGITTEEHITGEEITKEVKNRVVIRGNQVTLASRGTTQSAGYYSGGSGRLTYPTQGTITQYFTGRHTGVDIANRMGTNIVAAGDGVVTYVHYSNYSYGNYVVIDHLNGIVTRYAHCSKIYVNTGEHVNAGQSIAAMGSTGNSTGPHLHFEVLVNGAFVNPFSYL